MKQGCVEYAAYAEPEAGTGVASEPGSPVEVSGFVTVSSDFPSALIPKMISMIPPKIMIPPPMR